MLSCVVWFCFQPPWRRIRPPALTRNRRRCLHTAAFSSYMRQIAAMLLVRLWHLVFDSLTNHQQCGCVSTCVKLTSFQEVVKNDQQRHHGRNLCLLFWNTICCGCREILCTAQTVVVWHTLEPWGGVLLRLVLVSRLSCPPWTKPVNWVVSLSAQASQSCDAANCVIPLMHGKSNF